MSEASAAPVAPAWPALAQSYHTHHFKCPTCIAAGMGYGQRCHVGRLLWTAYQEAS